MSSCAPSTAVLIDCAAPLPITISPHDQLTDTTARQILAVDIWWTRVCAPKKKDNR